MIALVFATLFMYGVGVLIGPRRPEQSASTPPSVPAETPAYKQNITDEASAKYEPMIAAAWLQIPQDEKLIAAQKEVVAAQTSQARRAAEQQKLKELEDKLGDDRKAIDHLVREEQEERDRRSAEVARQKAAAQAAQAEAERQRRAQAEAERKEAERQAEREAEGKRQRAEVEYDQDGLVLLLKSVTGKRSEIGIEITGTVVNRRSDKLGYAQISFNLYDASGAQVGTALANINGLEPGGRWNFKALGLEGAARSYKFSELIGH
jgi:hypothetical protein